MASSRRTFARALEAELRLVEHAVLLVAAGGAPRVVVANLRYGRVIAEPASTFARSQGVSLALLPTATPGRLDFAASQLEEDASKPAMPATASNVPPA
jgi:hypothetical protein